MLTSSFVTKLIFSKLPLGLNYLIKSLELDPGSSLTLLNTNCRFGGHIIGKKRNALQLFLSFQLQSRHTFTVYSILHSVFLGVIWRYHTSSLFPKLVILNWPFTSHSNIISFLMPYKNFSLIHGKMPQIIKAKIHFRHRFAIPICPL